MSDKGFAALSVLFLLPLLATLLFSCLWVVWFLQTSMRMENICKEAVLKAQERLVSANNQVMALNPKASWLYFEKKALNIVILTAPPPAKAAAQVRKRVVQFQQRILQRTQRGLILKGNLLAKGHLFNLRRKFKEIINETHQRWGGKKMGASKILIEPSTSKLKVKLQDIAPLYKRSSDHVQAQQLSARWTVSLRDFFPDNLKSWIPIQKKWIGECFSHPHKGGVLWRAGIGKGKHSSKLSLSQ